MADKDNVRQIFENDNVRYICDVSIEVDWHGSEMGSLTKPGERRGIYFVSSSPQQPCQLLKDSSTLPAAMQQNVVCHIQSLAGRRA
jgi:hypothetical protein